jgi:3D (Asp-Asp-Asp) domain-containing protein
MTEILVALMLALAPVQQATVTAYTLADEETRPWNDGLTASGTIPVAYRTLACPRQHPFGTEVWIPGVGLTRCEDRGGAIAGSTFDLFIGDRATALRWGRRRMAVLVVPPEGVRP